MGKKIGIVMGSLSDLEVVKPAIALCEELGLTAETHVYSAHRCPTEAASFAEHAAAEGFGVLIAAAGMAAHLAGALAAHTVLPIIGIPVRSGHLGGLDALLSTVQMPPGVPVATVSVDGAYNAAMLAAQILAVEDSELSKKITKKREIMRQSVLEKDAQLQIL